MLSGWHQYRQPAAHLDDASCKQPQNNIFKDFSSKAVNVIIFISDYGHTSWPFHMKISFFKSPEPSLAYLLK